MLALTGPLARPVDEGRVVHTHHDVLISCQVPSPQQIMGSVGENTKNNICKRPTWSWTILLHLNATLTFWPSSSHPRKFIYRWPRPDGMFGDVSSWLSLLPHFGCPTRKLLRRPASKTLQSIVVHAPPSSNLGIHIAMSLPLHCHTRIQLTFAFCKETQ